MFDINLVVACTSRKRGIVAPELCFRTLPRAHADELAHEWRRRAVAVGGELRAAELYGGPAWITVLRAQARAATTRLAVLSAGFGLLTEDCRVPPYSATFAIHPDQVAARFDGSPPVGEAHRQWWSAINRACGRSETPLQAMLGDARHVILACGANYLEAVRDDLRGVAEQLGRERLVLICAGARQRELPVVLSRCLLPGGVDLQLIDNVPRSRLNHWTAAWLLGDIAERGWDPAGAGQRIQDAVAKRRRIGATLPKAGQRRTDDEVKVWIRAALEADPGVTGLHQRFRRQGLACEEKRFRHLAAAVRKQRAEAG